MGGWGGRGAVLNVSHVAPAPELQGEMGSLVTTVTCTVRTVWAVWTRFYCEALYGAEGESRKTSQGGVPGELSLEGHVEKCNVGKGRCTMACYGLSCVPQIHVLKS